MKKNKGREKNESAFFRLVAVDLRSWKLVNKIRKNWNKENESVIDL